MTVEARSARPSWLEVDSDALLANFRQAAAGLAPGCRFFAVIKADGYGAGWQLAARAAVAAGAHGLATGNPDIVPALRRMGIDLPLLLYPCSLPGTLDVLGQGGVIPTIHDAESLAGLAASDWSGEVYLKVDCGNGRLGADITRIPSLLAELVQVPRLQLGGVYAQFRNPDNVEDSSWQAGRFQQICAQVEAAGFGRVTRMVSSSLLMLHQPHLNFEAVNPGRILYGFAPDEVLERHGYRPVMSRLVSHLIQVREIGSGQPVHGERAMAKGPRRSGVIPLGFADGLNNARPSNVLVRGTLAPLLGNRSMEHSVVDLTHVPGAGVGDEVVLMGQQGKSRISFDEFAAANNIPPLELGVRLGRMAPRIHVGKFANSTSGHVDTPSCLQ